MRVFTEKIRLSTYLQKNRDVYDRQIDRQIDRQTKQQADRQTIKQTDIDK